MSIALVLSCEHGGNRVPAPYRELLRGARPLLSSHRGLDLGALELARDLQRRFGAPLHACTATRLLVDANRSRGHPRLFSPWTLRLPRAGQEALLERYWRPHRSAVERDVRARLGRPGLVVLLSVHSFTPRWKGTTRQVDVGFLFDPAHAGESELVSRWRAALAALRPDLRLRRNAPSRGTGDGLTTDLRQAPGPRYLGLELEVSQRFPRGSPPKWRRLRAELVDSLAAALDAFPRG